MVEYLRPILKTCVQIKQSQREGGVNKSKKQGTFAVEVRFQRLWCKSTPFSNQDFDAIGSITVNGQSTAAVELDMESLEDKPWRKVGGWIKKRMCELHTVKGGLENLLKENGKKLTWVVNAMITAGCGHHGLLQLRFQRGHLGGLL